MSDATPPRGISLERHLDLRGRGRYLWSRRAVLVVLLVIVAAGLANVFGQHAQTSAAAGSAASLDVRAPTRARGGDIFTARVRIQARTELKRATLNLDRGWFEGMTFNGSAPQATQESSVDGRTAFEFGDIPAGGSFVVFLSFQVNPNNVGHRSANVALSDGSRRIAVVDRSLTIWP
jgi:hypothetical protein